MTHPDDPITLVQCQQCGGSAYLCEQPDSTCRLKDLARDHHDRRVDRDMTFDQAIADLTHLLREVEDGAWDRLSAARTRQLHRLEGEVTELRGLVEEVVDALDDVLGTESDMPSFEETWDRAEALVMRLRERFPRKTPRPWAASGEKGGEPLKERGGLLGARVHVTSGQAGPYVITSIGAPAGSGAAEENRHICVRGLFGLRGDRWVGAEDVLVEAAETVPKEAHLRLVRLCNERETALREIIAELVPRCRECDQPAEWVEATFSRHEIHWCDEHVSIPQKAISKGANRYQPQRLRTPHWFTVALAALSIGTSEGT